MEEKEMKGGMKENMLDLKKRCEMKKGRHLGRKLCVKIVILE